MRRIHHRRDVVEIQERVLDDLADSQVVRPDRRQTKEIDRQHHAGGPQLRRQIFEEPPDDLALGLPGRFVDRVAQLGEVAVGREPDVVEVEFIDSGPCRFTTDLDQILPHLRRRRVHPAQAFAIGPDVALGIPDGQIRFHLEQMLVLKRGDPGDDVDAFAVEPVHERRQVETGDVGPQPPDQRVVGLEDHRARVVLDVDDHAVDLGGLRQMDRVAQAAGRRCAPRRQIDRPHVAASVRPEGRHSLRRGDLRTRDGGGDEEGPAQGEHGEYQLHPHHHGERGRDQCGDVYTGGTVLPDGSSKFGWRVDWEVVGRPS